MQKNGQLQSFINSFGKAYQYLGVSGLDDIHSIISKKNEKFSKSLNNPNVKDRATT